MQQGTRLGMQRDGHGELGAHPNLLCPAPANPWSFPNLAPLTSRIVSAT